MIIKAVIDDKICTNNKQTYREFIRESEIEFGMKAEPIDSFNNKEFNDYVEFLDYLWTK